MLLNIANYFSTSLCVWTQQFCAPVAKICERQRSKKWRIKDSDKVIAFFITNNEAIIDTGGRNWTTPFVSGECMTAFPIGDGIEWTEPQAELF